MFEVVHVRTGSGALWKATRPEGWEPEDDGSVLLTADEYAAAKAANRAAELEADTEARTAQAETDATNFAIAVEAFGEKAAVAILGDRLKGRG